MLKFIHTSLVYAYCRYLASQAFYYSLLTDLGVFHKFYSEQLNITDIWQLEPNMKSKL